MKSNSKRLLNFLYKLCYSVSIQASISNSIPEHMHNLVYMVGHLLVCMLVGTIVLSPDITLPALVTDPHLLHLFSFPSFISDVLNWSQVTSSYSSLLKDLELLQFLGSSSVSIISPFSKGCKRWNISGLKNSVLDIFKPLVSAKYTAAALA